MGLKEDILAAETKLYADIASVMENDVASATKSVMQQVIEDEVYAKYNPSYYVRRGYDGGLQDEKNIVSVYDRKTMTLEVTNMTRDNDYTGMGDRLVAPVVESGIGYAWKRIMPRPFHKKTEKLMANKIFENTLEAGLAVKGYKTR